MHGGETAVPACRLARRTDLAVVPARLRRLAYVFSGADRVVGAYGTLLSDEHGDLFLGDVLVCVTQVRRDVGDVDLVPLVMAELPAVGWSPQSRHALRRGPWLLHAVPADGDGLLSHVALALGQGRCALEPHVQGPVARHVAALRGGPCADRPSYRVQPVERSEVVQGLGQRRLLVHTGAGVSVDSAVLPFRGEYGLDARLGLEEEFPGVLVARMVTDPEGLARELGCFQASLLDAEPNDVHVLLAHLEAAGAVRGVVTTNLDGLHEAAGSTAVLDARSPTPLDPDDVLLVLGLSADECGLVEQARRSGMPIVVVDPTPPAYLRPGDVWVQSEAATFVRVLSRALTGERSADPVEHAPPPPDAPPLSAETGRLLAVGRWSGRVHGDRHARETAWLGLRLLSQHLEADPAVVLRFALLHDSARRSDGRDVDHGRRAAALVRALGPDVLGLSAAQSDLLAEACAGHADGTTASDPTIAVCWDADRLGLWRLGVPPQQVALSTPTARLPSVLAWARRARRRPPDWAALDAAYRCAKSRTCGVGA